MWQIKLNEVTLLCEQRGWVFRYSEHNQTGTATIQTRGTNYFTDDIIQAWEEQIELDSDREELMEEVLEWLSN